MLVFVYFIAHAAFVGVAHDLIEHVTARKLGKGSRVVVVNSWGELLRQIHETNP